MTQATSLNEVVASLYAAPLKPELWTVALRQLARAIDVRQAALFDHGPGTHRIFAFVGDPIIEGGRLYERHYWQYDEWTKRLSKAPVSRGLVFGESIWPEALLKRSVFYNDFLLKHEVCQIIGIPSYAGSGEFNCLSVYREPDGVGFDEDHCRTLRFLAPHVSTAFALRRRLLDLDSRVSDLEAALNQVRIALILLDRQGRPLLVNAAAKEICDKRDGLLLSSSGLAAASLRESANLGAVIERSASNIGAKEITQSGATIISRRNGRSLRVLVKPIPPGMVDAPGRAAAILLISDPERGWTLPEHVLRQLFSLTPAECRLALLLLTGTTLPNAADRLGVSRETVRSQMKSVLQKTGAKRQGDFVKLLAEISALGQQA
jgi:DNA-binding CsgD family transcriptional regulator/PAS domain-containing protein